MEFRWNDWNEGHISEHGVDPWEAEEVVREARPPYPLASAEGKFLVWGSTAEGRFLQVVFVVDEEDSVFVIHARPLTDKEKKLYRRRLR
jgi:uncharacterized DUF497 family protein